MLSTLQSQLGQAEMRIRGRCNNHHIHRVIIDQIFRTPVRLHARMVFLSIIVGFRLPLDDGVEIQFGHILDERDMEGFGAGAVPDDADIPGFGGHYGGLQ